MKQRAKKLSATDIARAQEDYINELAQKTREQYFTIVGKIQMVCDLMYEIYTRKDGKKTFRRRKVNGKVLINKKDALALLEMK